MLVVALGLLALLGGLAGFFLFQLRRFDTYHRHVGLPLPPSGASDLLRYFALELLGYLRLLWWGLVAVHRDGWLEPKGPATGPPVLCIHGITQAGSNFWGLRRELSKRGRRSRAVSYGRVRSSLTAHVPPVERALLEMAAEGPFDVVAHSMGGIVLRIALARHPELEAKIRRVITLGSPHFGTAAGRGFKFVPTIRSLGRRSSELAELRRFAPESAVTTFAAKRDLVVYPTQTCHLPGARNIDLDRVGHTGLLTHPAVIEEVAELLCAE